MRFTFSTLLLGTALLAASDTLAQTTPAPAPATPDATGTAPAQPTPPLRPGQRPPLRPRTAMPPRKGGAAQPTRAKTSGVMAKDGAMLTSGRVQYTELGMTTPLAADRKFVNGTSISPTGLVTNADGTTHQLGEGDYISLTGRVTTKREMADADSVRKMEDYFRKYPNKRKEMEKVREEAEKAREKAEKARAKEEAKAKKK